MQFWVTVGGQSQLQWRQEVDMNQDSFVPIHSGGTEILRRFGKSSSQLLAVIAPLIHPWRSHQPAVGPAETRDCWDALKKTWSSGADPTFIPQQLTFPVTNQNSHTTCNSEASFATFPALSFYILVFLSPCNKTVKLNHNKDHFHMASQRRDSMLGRI